MHWAHLHEQHTSLQIFIITAVIILKTDYFATPFW